MAARLALLGVTPPHDPANEAQYAPLLTPVPARDMDEGRAQSPGMANTAS